jgi:uncharacterized protein (DUF2235 family)
MKKCLVLCLDGTGNGTFERSKITSKTKIARPTNVLKIARAISLSRPIPDSTADKAQNTPQIPQIVYYDIGIGASPTYKNMGNRILFAADRIVGGITGAGLETNVEEALTFLTNNYNEGDEIFAFGFSRGAATVRVICNYIDWAGGLLSKDDAYFLPYLLRAYFENGTELNYQDALKRLPEGLKSPHGVPVKIKFIGVFDTVLAQKLSVTEDISHLVSDKVPSIVEHAYHALAIDEKRSDFLPDIWKRASTPDQHLEQRWFAGVHTNIGGSYPDDGLANCALDWMLLHARRLGLAYRTSFIEHYDPNYLGKLFNSKGWMYQVMDIIRVRAGNRYLSTESEIDISVVLRLLDKRCSAYRSDALMDYFNRAFEHPTALHNYLLAQIEQESERRLITNNLASIRQSIQVEQLQVLFR